MNKNISFNIIVPIIRYLAENHWDQMLNESLYARNEISKKLSSSL